MLADLRLRMRADMGDNRRLRPELIGQASLRRAIAEYMTHYHNERNHQGLENRLIRCERGLAANDNVVYRCSRIGGMLSYYHRAAA